MKKTITLALLVFVFVSCRKDPGLEQLRFSASYANGMELLKYDSIAYTTVKYSDLAELDDSHTVDLNIKTEYLSLKGGHTYSFLKFEMVGKSGKVMYYIPLKSDTASESMTLPIHFRIPENSGASLLVNVIRYPY